MELLDHSREEHDGLLEVLEHGFLKQRLLEVLYDPVQYGALDRPRSLSPSSALPIRAFDVHALDLLSLLLLDVDDPIDEQQ